jgi:hypothetical protein
MEDLFEKFYGKPESEGSSDAPPPPPSEPDDRVVQVEQRVGRVETQLLQIAKAQQTILSRLDSIPDRQELIPPSDPPENPSTTDDPRKYILAHSRSSTDTPSRTCSVCGCGLSVQRGLMTHETFSGSEALHCPRCYEQYRKKRQQRRILIAILVPVAMILFLLIAAGCGIR